MPANKAPVVAAIHNDNNGDYLEAALAPLLEQDYAGIVVLDNASRDQSREVVEGYGKSVEWLPTRQHLKRGANRNRILDSHTLDWLNSTVIVHYVDSGTQITSTHNPAILQDEFKRPELGLLGGLVLNRDGSQFMLNWGENVCGPARLLRAYGSAAVLTALDKYKDIDRDRAAAWRGRLDFILKDWPNTFRRPQPRYVGYAYEANMAVRASDLKKVGGFPDYKIHEVQKVAMELSRHEQRCRFNPDISSRILEDNTLAELVGEHIKGLFYAARLATHYSLPANRKPLQ